VIIGGIYWFSPLSDWKNLSLYIFIILVFLYGIYINAKDDLFIKRLIIYDNGFIPPTQNILDFINKYQNFKFFDEIAEMLIVNETNESRYNNFKIYLNDEKIIYIYYYQLEKEAMNFFIKLKHEKFPEERRKYFEEAERMIKYKRFDEALELINKANDINPNAKLYWNTKGVALGELKRYEEALEAFDKALNLSPKYRMVWENKAFALENLGKLQEAVDCYNKAMELTTFHKSEIRGKRDKIMHNLMYKQKEQ